MSEPWKIPKSWRWSTMGEVAEVVGGGTPKTENPNYFGGDIPWITPADLSGYRDKFISNGARNITQTGLENSGARLMPAGSILFSSRAPIGYVAVAANAVSTNQGFKSFVLRNGLTSDYVYYYLQLAKKLALELASGTTFLEISGKKAAQIPIPIAPLDEQGEIVAEIEKQFTRLDVGVTGLRRVQANLKRYRAAVLKAACEGELVPTEADLARQEGRSYETGAQLLACVLTERRQKWNGKGTYKEPAKADTANLPRLPEGWGWASLEAITEALGGFAFESKKFCDSGFQVLKMANVRMGRIDLRQRPSFINEMDQEIVAKYKLLNGDVVVTLTGSRKKEDYGYVAVIKNAESLLLNQRIARLRCRGGVLPAFLEMAMQSENFRRRFFSYETGNVGQGNVGMTAITKESIALAPVAEQRRIVAELERRLSVVEELEAVVNSNLQRATRLRQSILQKAFAGCL